MRDRFLTLLTNFRCAILCATIGFAEISLAQIGLAEISPAHAASFTTAVSKAGQTIVLLDGEIEPSDSTKLSLIVTGLDNQGRAVSALYLNSPGGNGRADLRMAALVKRFKISTIVADGAECMSACFTVFAAGHGKFAGYHAQIGVHRVSYKERETAAAIVATVELVGVIRELGVPAAIIGKLMQTPPDQMAWLTPGDLRSMNVMVTGMLRWPVPLEPGAASARSRASSRHHPHVHARPQRGTSASARVFYALSGRLTPFKPEGMSWPEYVALALELSRRTFGPDHLREDCSAYTKLCSRSFAFLDGELVRTHVTTVEDASGNAVQQEVCKSNMPDGVRSCFDWHTREWYHVVLDGPWRRKRPIAGAD